MATRTMNRRPRRAPPAPVAPPAAPAAPLPKPRVRRKVVNVPPRLFARWAVCDNGMKCVATFEYRDRAGADAKLADLLDRKAGGYFLQLRKEPHADPAPVCA